MDKNEEEKLSAILDEEKLFLDTINYSGEPVIHPLDMLNGFLIDNIPEEIFKKLVAQII